MKFSMRHKFNSDVQPLTEKGLVGTELQPRAGLGKTVDKQLFSFVAVLMTLLGSIAYTASSYQRFSTAVEREIEFQKNTRLEQAALDARSGLYWGTGFTVFSVATILGLTILSLRAQKLNTKKERQQNIELQASQVALQQLNSDLEAKGQELELQSQKLAAQEEALRMENEILQDDIAHLLDVVSAVEEGDFTAQAQVNDRITGLVSDTLNRLIEQLGRVLGEVVNASEQVTHTSVDLEALAKNVASYAAEQEQGATQVLTLTKQVQTSTQFSAQQVNRAGQSLQQMSMLVDQGVNELQGMNFGIEVLQSGTDRIVQQMKTLGEFVGLADQFVQEQSQVASLTQVLSLNATLVAARASEQRDPRQFAVVAREFEQIAAQVGQLAQQTSDSLGMLQQRTTSIYNAVSTIDTDVQSLGNLVQGFTQGVVSSNESFAALQTVAADVVSASEAVSQANQEIVDAAQRTARSMGQMAQTAKQTVTLTQQAESQTQSMEELSHQLYDRITFFRLPDMTTATVAAAKAVPTATADDLVMLAQVAQLDLNPAAPAITPTESPSLAAPLSGAANFIEPERPASEAALVERGASLLPATTEPIVVTILTGDEPSEASGEIGEDQFSLNHSYFAAASEQESPEEALFSGEFVFDEMALDEIPSEALFSDSMMVEPLLSEPLIQEPLIQEPLMPEPNASEGMLFEDFWGEDAAEPNLEAAPAAIEHFEGLDDLEELEDLANSEAREDISVIGV
jgi:methyl-accepting chemotaxis protein